MTLFRAAKGTELTAGLQEAQDHASANLPIPKVMRYQLADGITSVKFVRPAHRLIALWGNDVIKVSTLGLQAGRDTLGHRFMAGQIISIATPESYESQLHQQGKVIASFQERQIGTAPVRERVCRY